MGSPSGAFAYLTFALPKVSKLASKKYIYVYILVSHRVLELLSTGKNIFLLYAYLFPSASVPPWGGGIGGSGQGY